MGRDHGPASRGRAPVAADPELDRALRGALDGRRCVFVAGLPGVGKSLVVQRAARIAAGLGRSVHLLQWDVARLAFDTPGILARYPEQGSVTHPAIRLAVGLWARDAVRRWDRDHPDPRGVLIGETPLVGERLMELARPRDDAIEPLLASERTLFVVPVPSAGVRRAVEAARAREIAGPRHARDAASAPPHLVRWHWDDLVRVAALLGAGSARKGRAYDPALYAAAYRALLRGRHVLVLPMTRVLETSGSTHAPPSGATEVVPSDDDVDHAMTRVEHLGSPEVERRTEEWYRT